MRIAHVGPARMSVLHPTTGAIERRMLWLARTQAAAGHDVRLYSRGEIDEVREIDGYRLVSVACPLRDKRFAVLDELYLLYRAGHDMRGFEPDVIHSHSVPEASLLGPRDAARFISYDHFQFRRGSATPLFHPLRRMLARYTALLPVSEDIARASVEYWKLPDTACEIVANGVDLDRFRPDPAAGLALRRRLGIPEDALVMLWAGRVNYVKGIDLMCEAYRAALRSLPKLRLLVVGPPDAFGNEGSNRFVEIVRESGGDYHPAVGESELPAFFNSADIFVYASRNEPFGMAAAEAQACGKPVIASQVGGLPEVIGEGGLLFRSGDAAHLAARIVDLSDPRVRGRLAGAALVNAARFDWRRICRQLDSIYARPHTSAPRPALTENPHVAPNTTR